MRVVTPLARSMTQISIFPDGPTSIATLFSSGEREGFYEFARLAYRADESSLAIVPSELPEPGGAAAIDQDAIPRHRIAFRPFFLIKGNVLRQRERLAFQLERFRVHACANMVPSRTKIR